MVLKKDLHKMNTKELGKLFPIIIQEPNKNWEKRFKIEKKIIIDSFKTTDLESIEHIGSTAIPNLKAKPIIDILVEVSHDLNDKIIIKNFENIKYHYIQQPDNPPPHMMFVKGYFIDGFKGQAFHVHVRYKGDWNEIYFRDYLRKNQKTAKKYEELKLQLALKHKNNREAYTQAKTDFIETINKLARDEKK